MAARKQRRNAAGHVDPYFQRRRRFQATLEPLGLWAAFARVPRYYQELFWQRKLPDPTVEFDATVPGGAAGRAMRREVELRLREAEVQINSAPIRVRDFLSIVTGCMLVVQQTRVPGLPDEVMQFVRTGRPVLEQCWNEHLLAVIRSMYEAVAGVTLAHSRLDTRLLAVRLEFPSAANGKVQTRIIVSATQPQQRSIKLDGIARPMYRVAELSPAGVTWVSWNGEMAGTGDAKCEYPVFVQSHALRQLHQRINLPTAAPFLETWLADSLNEPVIVERQGEDLLVEFRIQKDRLGYLICTPLKDQQVVAVRTFKFLTMEQTPEARLLNKQLHLTRRDVDWLGLHELAAFTQTDLSKDPVLRPLLEKCGCGHLFAWAEKGEEGFAPEPKAFAAEMKRYLRMAA